MDFLSDKSGRHLLRINNTVTVPDYVKQADVDESLVAALPISCFADQVHGEFPINNPAHVFLSYSYCKSASVTNPVIIDRIKKAGSKLGISKDLEDIDAAFGRTKQASVTHERDYAIVIDFGDGGETVAGVNGVQNFYPLNNQEEVKNSAVALDNDKRRLPLSLYVQGARQVVKIARALKMEERELPERITLYGTERLTNFEHVGHEAARRVAITGDDVYDVITKSAAENEEKRDMDDYIKLWDLADARNGVTCSKNIPDPYRIFNVGLAKRAYETSLHQHILLSGAVVPVAAIAQVDTVAVQKQFPKEAATAILSLVKTAAEAATDDAALLAASLSGSVQKALLRLIVA